MFQWLDRWSGAMSQTRSAALMAVAVVAVGGALASQPAKAQSQGAGGPLVPSQTVQVNGQPLSFAVPPGYCLVPQNSPYAGTFYTGAAAAGAAGQSGVQQTVLAAFLPCTQVRDPQVSPIVAYQTWAVTTRYGAAVTLGADDLPADVLGPMYALTQQEGYRQQEQAGLEAISRSLSSALVLDKREEVSGLRENYLYRAYTVPVQGIAGLPQICAATAFVVVKGVIVRHEQLAPCEPGATPAETSQALVGDVTGQIEYFLALNGQAAVSPAPAR